MKKVTLVPNKAKALASTAVTVAKSPLDMFKASGIGDRMRKTYTDTFEGDPISSLSDDYLMKVYEDTRAANPGANDERMWTENGDGIGIGLLAAAMVQAEYDPQQQETSTSAIDIPASNVRTSAHEAAMVLSQDAAYASIQDAIIDAERTRKQAPAELAWTLERLYVRRDATGKLLCNMIEGDGPEFDKTGKHPWPIIGTEEKDKAGNIVNNPDVIKKFIGNKQQTVSYYGEVVRDTPRGASLVERREQYLLAAAKVPTGPFSDRTSPDYLDQLTADKKAEECKADIDTMVKSLKRAVTLLRHMWAFNEMAAPNSPPRCTASFRVEKKWNPDYTSPEGHKGQWIDDPSKLAKLDSPILLTDKLGQEIPAMMRIGEFISHDPVAAGKAGGTIDAFRKAVSKQKRKAGSGTGKTEESKEKEKTVLQVADLDKAIAAVATSFETPAARGNFLRFLNGKPEESDAALVSTWHVAMSIIGALASQPDLCKRIATLEKVPLSFVNEQIGLGKVADAATVAAKTKVA